MGTYDSRRLDIAIQYIRRMAEGRNPVNNRPAPENEVLTNVNVNRCLKFVEEILTDVRSAGGTVGLVQKSSAARKPSIAEIFPYEVLSGFKYEQDQQISYFLKQVTGLLPEDQSMTIQATMVTDWLRENGYLEKRMFKETGKENSVPTEKGIDLGLYAEKAGAFPNEYYRVYYNQNAQQFIVDNLRRILTETAEIRARNRREKNKSALSEKQKALQQTGPAEKKVQEAAASPRNGEGENQAFSGRGGQEDNARSIRGNGFGQKSGFSGRDGFKNNSGTARGNGFGENPGFSGKGRVEEDPGFASLVSSLSADYTASQGDWSDPAASDAYDSFMGEGWQSADDGLPW